MRADSLMNDLLHNKVVIMADEPREGGEEDTKHRVIMRRPESVLCISMLLHTGSGRRNGWIESAWNESVCSFSFAEFVRLVSRVFPCRLLDWLFTLVL